MFPGHYMDFCHLRNILERDHFLDILSYIIFKQIPLIKEITLIFSCLLQRILLLVPLRVQPEEWKALTYSISLSTTSDFLGKSLNSLNHHQIQLLHPVSIPGWVLYEFSLLKKYLSIYLLIAASDLRCIMQYISLQHVGLSCPEACAV